VHRHGAVHGEHGFALVADGSEAFGDRAVECDHAGVLRVERDQRLEVARV
jgi:hypothetical protein